MKAKDVAVWFLNKNPDLYFGYNDENTKLNKLVFFLQYDVLFCVWEEPC